MISKRYRIYLLSMSMMCTFGCQSGKVDQHNTLSTVKPSIHLEKECHEEHLSAMTTFVKKICTSGALGHMKLVKTSSTLNTAKNYFQVIVSSSWIELSGYRIEGNDWLNRLDDKLYEEMVKLKSISELRNESTKTLNHVNLGIAPNVPFIRVIKIIKRLSSRGVKQFSFLFDGGDHDLSGLAPGAVEAIKALPVSPPNLRQKSLVEFIRQASSGCSPLQDVFSALATVRPNMRCPLLTNGLPIALRKCSCTADVDRVVGAMIELSNPRLVVSTVRFGDVKNEELTVVRNKIWAEVAPEIIKVSGRVLAPFTQ